MGLKRRTLLEIGGGTGLVVASSAAGYGLRGLLSGERDAVPGFVWSDDDFEPFRNDALREVSPRYEGDSKAGRGRYDGSPTVALVGTLATGALSSLTEEKGRRLGIAYTDPGGEWHLGCGRPGQVFGGAVYANAGDHLVAALGIGPGDVEFSWVIRDDKKGLVLPLATLAIGGGPMQREEAARQFPGVPHL